MNTLQSNYKMPITDYISWRKKSVSRNTAKLEISIPLHDMHTFTAIDAIDLLNNSAICSLVTDYIQISTIK